MVRLRHVDVRCGTNGHVNCDIRHCDIRHIPPKPAKHIVDAFNMPLVSVERRGTQQNVSRLPRWWWRGVGCGQWEELVAMLAQCTAAKLGDVTPRRVAMQMWASLGMRYVAMSHVACRNLAMSNNLHTAIVWAGIYKPPRTSCYHTHTIHTHAHVYPAP